MSNFKKKKKKSSQHLLIPAYINNLNFHHMPMHVCVISHFSRVQLFATSWTEAARLLCPWDFPSRNTGVGSPSLLQGIFPTTQGLNPHLSCPLH